MFTQCRIQAGLEDRRCGSECVRADAEHAGIARTQHSCRIHADVRSALKHECHDSERTRELLDHPTFVDDGVDHVLLAHRRLRPHQRAVDHSLAHLVVDNESADLLARSTCGIHIGIVGLTNLRKNRVVRKTTSKRMKELGDCLVGRRSEFDEAMNSSCDCIAGQRHDVGSDNLDSCRQLDEQSTVPE